MMKLILICCLPVLIFILFSSCDTNEPLPEGAIGLTLEDVSCTEAWITLTVENLQGTAYIRITNNGNLIETLEVTGTKTLLYYDTLQPNTNYEFQAFSSQRGEDIIGNKLQFTTLDTTSHNFTWQTFTFGEHSSSTLYDVAIINENNIWAVGEIYMNDSLGNPDPNSYNAVHWDGQIWELKRINMQSSCNPVTYPLLRAIWVFSENNIVVTSGGSIGWFDGIINRTDCNIRPLLSGTINKLWGSSSTDLYAVGNNGNIAHYNGSSWKKIESGTVLPINDIWGINDNGKTKIFAVASNIYNFQDKKILSISSSGITEISNTGLPLDLGSVWFSNTYNSYVGGDGLYVKYYSQNDWTRIELPTYFIFSIRGNGLNDMIVCGGLGYIGHFNGSTWINYLENGIGEIQGNYYSSAIKGNKFVAVGGIVGGKAIAIIGSR